jgi:hypothetical protein
LILKNNTKKWPKQDETLVKFPDFFLRRFRSDPFPVLGGTTFTHQNQNRLHNQMLMNIEDRKLSELRDRDVDDERFSKKDIAGTVGIFA